jgi:hypothetical protein
LQKIEAVAKSAAMNVRGGDDADPQFSKSDCRCLHEKQKVGVNLFVKSAVTCRGGHADSASHESDSLNCFAEDTKDAFPDIAGDLPHQPPPSQTFKEIPGPHSHSDESDYSEVSRPTTPSTLDPIITLPHQADSRR